MPAARERPRDLREASAREAQDIVDDSGIEALSLREVARRLGVSHQAPYKHFPTRDHLLAEVVARGYREFAEHLDARSRAVDPASGLEAMGRAYIDFAATHPGRYRLLFGTPLPDPADHPRMMAEARHAFGLLASGIAALPGARRSRERIDHDAIFIWSALHGLASLTATSAFATVELPRARLDHALEEVLARIGVVLGKPSGVAPELPPVSPPNARRGPDDDG